MITKSDILKLARHVARRSRGLPDKKLVHPYREWYVGLVFMLVLIIAGAMYNFYLFRYYHTVEARVGSEQIDVPTYRSDTAERVEGHFNKRTAVFNAIQTTAASAATITGPVDASLAPQQ